MGAEEDIRRRAQQLRDSNSQRQSLVQQMDQHSKAELRRALAEVKQVCRDGAKILQSEGVPTEPITHYAEKFSFLGKSKGLQKETVTTGWHLGWFNIGVDTTGNIWVYEYRSVNSIRSDKSAIPLSADVFDLTTYLNEVKYSFDGHRVYLQIGVGSVQVATKHREAGRPFEPLTLMLVDKSGDSDVFYPFKEYLVEEIAKLAAA